VGKIAVTVCYTLALASNKNGYPGNGFQYKLPKIGNFNAYSDKQITKMGKNTSISIGLHFDSFIQKQIDTGRYASASEVVRAGLRLLEEEEQKLKLLRQALIDGEESGWVENFNPVEFKTKLKVAGND
jgi:antitoxin ParD1/3/4